MHGCVIMSASSILRQTSAVLAGIVMVILAAAGALKSLDLDSFRASLDGFQFVSFPLRTPIALVLPPLEIMLGGLWILGMARRHVEIMGLGLLAAFTVVLVAHLWLAEPPQCQCFGLIDQFFRQIGDAQRAVWRAGGMLAAISLAHVRWLVAP